MPVQPITTVDQLLGLLADASSTEGEGLDQLAHGLQCAYELEQTHPDDPELQVAGLVHDIGHRLLPKDDRVDHDLVHGVAAGDAVRDLLGERVATLVELHVPAKRYLVSVESEYGDVLSPMSALTLANQGGPMTPDEIDEFEELPELAAAVALRRADEAAKVPGREVPGLDHWRPIIESLAR
jgi:predicted HD phosphohydrolase